ncbi:MAG: EAL domain-containing protein [Candidatus Dormibacteria bacterium]
MANRIRLLLADDDLTVLANLGKMLALEDEIEVVGVANDAEQAIALAATALPDVVLTDVNMPLGGGVRATEGIRAASPHTHVIAHSAYGDRAAVMQMVRAGAIGYLVKGANAADLMEVVRRAARGEAILSAPITSTVILELASILRQKEQAADAQRSHHAVFRRLSMGEGMSVLFQPVIELAGGDCVGYEALARFDVQPERSTRAWFEEAETVGFRVEMELRAIRSALVTLGQLPPQMFLEVNASPATVMSPEFDRLLDPGSEPRLVLDISARDHFADYRAFQLRLREFRDRGLRVAVDDVGAADGDVQHLLHLGPEIIKFDTTVIQAIGGYPAFKAFARSMIGFARETQASVVAEGVEHPEDLEAVRTLGVTQVQGSLFGVPDALGGTAAQALS